MEANEENGCGWVVKGPFTTNSQCIKFVHSFDEMKVAMCPLSKKYFGNLPYLMIQPCMCVQSQRVQSRRVEQHTYIQGCNIYWFQ